MKKKEKLGTIITGRPFPIINLPKIKKQKVWIVIVDETKKYNKNFKIK